MDLAKKGMVMNIGEIRQIKTITLMAMTKIN
jgi:hypothetical protein